MMRLSRPVWIVLAALALVPAVAWACPFCSAVSQTFTEEINTVQVAVIAKLVEQPKPKTDAEAEPELNPAANVEKTKFEINQIIKGEEHLKGIKQIEVLYFGQQPKGTKFLILGIDPPDIGWNAPVPLTDRAVEYIGKLLSLPEKGADRLAFFQDYLEDNDELLARDAYDEFAKAPYSEVKDLKDRMHKEKLLAWIQDKDVLASRRRLYLTMLGVCGNKEDAQMLEEMIAREEPEGEPKSALDAMIACYLTLKGPEGMPLIEEKFLKNKKAEYTDTYSAIMALRFHGQEETIIPKPRLVEALRHMLDRADLADLVIPDLARWEDWQSMDRLVTLFKEADEKTSWVRVPVINFLKACPLPEAKERIAELEKIDPESVKRASFFVGYAAAKPADKPAGEGASDPAPATAGKEKDADKPAETALVPPPTVAAKEKDKGATTAENKSEPMPAEDTKPEEKVAAQPLPPKPVAEEEDQPREKSDESSKVPVASATPPSTGSDASPTGDNTSAAHTESNSSWIAFVPVAVGLVLLVLLLVIVRGGVGRAPTEVKS